MNSDTPTPLVKKLLAARRDYMKTHWREFDRYEMSGATLKALAAECGQMVEDPDALRDKDGNLLNPSPPMIFGRPIFINDSIPLGDFHMLELFPAALSDPEEQ